MRDAKPDANQAEIVQALRDAHVLVFDTHTIGRGFPDIVALRDGQIHLLEIKADGGKLTEAEQAFFAEWGDCEFVHIVHSLEDAFAAVGIDA